MTLYLYSLHDPLTGALLHQGTARELVQMGLYSSVEGVSSSYISQQGSHTGRVHKWKIRRSRLPKDYRKARQADPEPGKSQKAPKPPAAPAKRADRDPLQRDVHDLVEYNRRARQLGLRELSYGYWAAAGKPARPEE